MHFFKHRYFLIVTISCNNNFWMFCGIFFTNIPVCLSYAILYFCASFPFYSFLGALVLLYGFPVQTDCSRVLQMMMKLAKFSVISRYLVASWILYLQTLRNIIIILIYKMSRKQLKEGIKEDWSVPVILSLNNNYYSLIQHYRSIWFYLYKTSSDVV